MTRTPLALAAVIATLLALGVEFSRGDLADRIPASDDFEVQVERLTPAEADQVQLRISVKNRTDALYSTDLDTVEARLSVWPEGGEKPPDSPVYPGHRYIPIDLKPRATWVKTVNLPMSPMWKASARNLRFQVYFNARVEVADRRSSGRLYLFTGTVDPVSASKAKIEK